MFELQGDMIECDCGLRYMRRESPSGKHEHGDFRCGGCGETLGSWDGLYTVVFDPEDVPPEPFN